jgi:hypothetical protein
MAFLDLKGEVVNRQELPVVLCQVLHFYHSVTSLFVWYAFATRCQPRFSIPSRPKVALKEALDQKKQGRYRAFALHRPCWNRRYLSSTWNPIFCPFR